MIVGLFVISICLIACLILLFHEIMSINSKYYFLENNFLKKSIKEYIRKYTKC